MTLGLSGLYGSLPFWSLDSLDKMVEGPRLYAEKYRLGLDNTIDWGPSTLRLEGVVGKDGGPRFGTRSELSGNSVMSLFGYYGEARYAITRWLEPMVAYDGFHTAEGSARTLSAGVNFYPPEIPVFELQTAYQRNFLNTASQNREDWHAIAQLVVRF
jgi:hypothetical protein